MNGDHFEQIVSCGHTSAFATCVDLKRPMVVHEENGVASSQMAEPDPPHASITIILPSIVFCHGLFAAFDHLPSTPPISNSRRVIGLDRDVSVRQFCKTKHPVDIIALLEAHDVIRPCLLDDLTNFVPVSVSKDVPPFQVEAENFEVCVTIACRLQFKPLDWDLG